MMKRSKWCLIGIPDHEGVMNVGGRVGAAGGPTAFRRAFSRLKGRENIHDQKIDRGDAGPMIIEIEKNHQTAARLIQQAHQDVGLSIIVGGGHDHGYSHLLGISKALSNKKVPKLGCINIDAHLDLRKPTPAITSGSPFYLAIESGVLHPKHLVEFGIQRHCNTAELWNYAESKKIPIVPFEKLRHGKVSKLFKQSLKALARQCDAIVISLDLDSACCAFAPGVSAPQIEGFTPTDILEMMMGAGGHPKVVSLGIFELNPIHDIDDRTARLGAVAAYHFLSYALRL